MITGRSLRAGRPAAATIVVLAALGVTSAIVSAHRLDECLQAARIAVEPGRVELEVSLTPGVDVVDTIIHDLDRNGDGLLTAGEQSAFARAVVVAIELTHDHVRLELTPDTTAFPEIDALRRGEGTIRLRSVAVLPPQSDGIHNVSFRNGFRPDVSVYLANALVPESERIVVTAQHHAADQRDLTIDYIVRDVPATLRSAWPIGILAAALVAVVMLPTARRRRHRDGDGPT